MENDRKQGKDRRGLAIKKGKTLELEKVVEGKEKKRELKRRDMECRERSN